MAQNLKTKKAKETKTENTVAQPADIPQITVGDLTTMVNIIDAGSQRGAWRGEELAVVGGLRNKLAAILTVLNPTPVETPKQGEGDENK